MRIDSHQHFWKYNRKRDSWMDDSMPLLCNDFLPEHLEVILKAHKIDGCIAVQADQSETETKFLLDCAEQNEFIKGVVGWVDLCADDIEERLSHFSRNKYFKGVRHIVQSEKEDFILRDDFQRGIAHLNSFGLTYDILVFPNQLKNVIKLTSKFPNQKFVLDHMAKPYIKDGKISAWQTDIIALAKNPNVFCKLSGMLTEADWKNCKNEDFKHYFDTIFKAFGTERILYGSDWPVSLLAGDYKQVLQVVKNYMRQFSKEKKALVMGINACAFYNLEQ